MKQYLRHAAAGLLSAAIALGSVPAVPGAGGILGGAAITAHAEEQEERCEVIDTNIGNQNGNLYQSDHFRINTSMEPDSNGFVLDKNFLATVQSTDELLIEKIVLVRGAGSEVPKILNTAAEMTREGDVFTFTGFEEYYLQLSADGDSNCQIKQVKIYYESAEYGIETFDTGYDSGPADAIDINPYTYSGKYFLLDADVRGNTDGFCIHDTNYAYILPQKNVIITKITAERGNGSGVPAIDSDSASRTQDGSTFTFTNVNANIVRMFDQNDACQIKQVKIYYKKVSGDFECLITNKGKESYSGNNVQIKVSCKGDADGFYLTEGDYADVTVPEGLTITKMVLLRRFGDEKPVISAESAEAEEKNRVFTFTNIWQSSVRVTVEEYDACQISRVLVWYEPCREVFQTNQEEESYIGTHFLIDVKDPGDDDGFYITPSEPAVITALDNCVITKLVLIRGCFDDTPKISSDTAEMTQNGDAFTFTNVNQSIVTVSADDGCQIDWVIIYFQPADPTLSDNAFEVIPTNLEEETYIGTHVLIEVTAPGDDDGFSITPSDSAVITALDNCVITKLVLIRGCYNGTPKISSDTAEMTQDDNIFTFTNVNQSTVTVSADDICQIKRAVIYYQPAEPKLSDYSVTLGEDLGMNFYVSGITSQNAADYTVKLGNCDEDDKLPLSEKNGRYYVTAHVAANQMRQEITAQLCKNNTPVGETVSTSIDAYLIRLSEQETLEPRVRDMVDATRAYGLTAENYFNGTSFTGYLLREPDTDELNSYKAVSDALGDAKLSLVLNAKVTLRVYAEGAEKGNPTAESQPLTPMMMRTDQKFGGYTASAYTWVYRVLTAESASQKNIDMAKAVFGYMEAAARLLSD